MELWSGRFSHFIVTLPVTNGPLSAVQIGRETPRRLAPRTGIQSEAAKVKLGVSRVSVCELR